MKDNLLEMLLNLFEKTLTQLKEQHTANNVSGDKDQSMVQFSENKRIELLQGDCVALPQARSLRVFTEDERLKFTKSSYQFLMRMVSLGILAHEKLERVVHRMVFSDSRFVSLQETKWIIRHTLADALNPEDLAFLDLVLYQSEDNMALH